jgi:hypothetical protein
MFSGIELGLIAYGHRGTARNFLKIGTYAESSGLVSEVAKLFRLISTGLTA